MTAPSENARAVSLITPEQGERLTVVGDLVTLKVPSAATGGAFCAFEERTPPGGGPPPHVHQQAEIFYVLSGDVEFFHLTSEGPQTVNGTPGTVCSIAGESAHTFKNIGTTESHVYVFTVPGGLDDFFRAIGDPTNLSHAPGILGEPDMERILAASEKYGVRFVELNNP